MKKIDFKLVVLLTTIVFAIMTIILDGTPSRAIETQKANGEKYLSCSYVEEGNQSTTYTYKFVTDEAGGYHYDAASGVIMWGLGTTIAGCPNSGQLFRLNSGIVCGIDFKYDPSRHPSDSVVCDKDARGNGTVLIIAENQVQDCTYKNIRTNEELIVASNYLTSSGYSFLDPDKSTQIDDISKLGLDGKTCIPVVAITDENSSNSGADILQLINNDDSRYNEFANQKKVTIFVDGNQTDIFGALIDDATYVSIKELCQYTKCQYGYDNGLKKLVIKSNDNKFSIKCSSVGLCELFDGSKSSNQKTYNLRTVPKDGKFSDLPSIGETGDDDIDVLVPVRFIAEGLGKDVLWNGEESRVDINTRALKGTLVNIPVDSRPVSRSNFENLVRAAGWQYQEVGNGVADYTNKYDSKWMAGDSAATRTQASSIMAESDSPTTVAIVNMSQYMFDGLIGTRIPSKYSDENIAAGLNDLKSLIKNNPKSTFYLSYAIPRSLPETRGDTYDKAISDWYGCRILASDCVIQSEKDNWTNCHNNDSPCDMVKAASYAEAFQTAVLDYIYLFYYSRGEDSNAIQSCNDSQESLDCFTDSYNKLKGSLTTEQLGIYKAMWDKWGENTIKDYLTMYDKSLSLIEQLNVIKNSCDSRCHLVLGAEDPAIPNEVNCNEPQQRYTTCDNGNPIKYTGVYYVQKRLSPDINNTKLGIDEINHLIFAKELMVMENKSLKDLLWSPWNGTLSSNVTSNFDHLTLGGVVDSYASFVGIATSAPGCSKGVICSYIVGGDGGTEEDGIITALNNSNDVMAIFNLPVSEESDKNLRNSLGPELWYSNMNAGGWNTIGNAVGIQLARSIVYEVLRGDIVSCVKTGGGGCSNTKVSSDLSFRTNYFDKSRVVGVLEDLYYNTTARTGEFGIKGEEYNPDGILNELNGKELSIGGYQYRYSSVSATASNPFGGRGFEAKINPNLGM